MPLDKYSNMLCLLWAVGSLIRIQRDVYIMQHKAHFHEAV